MLESWSRNQRMTLECVLLSLHSRYWSTELQVLIHRFKALLIEMKFMISLWPNYLREKKKSKWTINMSSLFGCPADKQNLCVWLHTSSCWFKGIWLMSTFAFWTLKIYLCHYLPLRSLPCVRTTACRAWTLTASASVRFSAPVFPQACLISYSWVPGDEANETIV